MYETLFFIKGKGFWLCLVYETIRYKSTSVTGLLSKRTYKFIPPLVLLVAITKKAFNTQHDFFSSVILIYI